MTSKAIPIDLEDHSTLIEDDSDIESSQLMREGFEEVTPPTWVVRLPCCGVHGGGPDCSLTMGRTSTVRGQALTKEYVPYFTQRILLT